MTYRSRKLLDLAHDMPCMAKFEHVCNGPSVPAHANGLQFGRGSYHKAPDCFFAAVCPEAHDLIDGRKGGWEKELKRSEWMRAYIETPVLLVVQRIGKGDEMTCERCAELEKSLADVQKELAFSRHQSELRREDAVAFLRESQAATAYAEKLKRELGEAKEEIIAAHDCVTLYRKWGEERTAVIRRLLKNLPNLWGDHVIQGEVTLKLDEEAIDAALEVLELGNKHAERAIGPMLRRSADEASRVKLHPGSTPGALHPDPSPEVHQTRTEPFAPLDGEFRSVLYKNLPNLYEYAETPQVGSSRAVAIIEAALKTLGSDEGSDAYYNLMGARIDSAEGRFDDVCVRTMQRVEAQVGIAMRQLREGLEELKELPNVVNSGEKP